jgi:hypothetical protein
MKKSLKYALIAGAGYAIYTKLKRNELTTNEALKHSVDRRLSVENQSKKEGKK